MKKLAYLLMIVFALGVLSSSCNRKSCPAYSQSNTEQTENPQS